MLIELLKIEYSYTALLGTCCVKESCLSFYEWNRHKLYQDQIVMVVVLGGGCMEIALGTERM